MKKKLFVTLFVLFCLNLICNISVVYGEKPTSIDFTINSISGEEDSYNANITYNGEEMNVRKGQIEY